MPEFTQCIQCQYYHRPKCDQNRIVETGFSPKCKFGIYDPNNWWKNQLKEVEIDFLRKKETNGKNKKEW